MVNASVGVHTHKGVTINQMIHDISVNLSKGMPTLLMVQIRLSPRKEEEMITHKYDSDDCEYGPIRFHHHGDYSGDVHINVSKDAVQRSFDATTERAEVHIPFDALKMLVVAYMRRKMIIALEQSSDDDLIELLTGLSP